MPAQQIVNDEYRSLTGANGGAAITGLTTFGLLPGTKYCKIHARAFATAVGLQWSLNPFLAVLKTTDGGATWTDYSEAAQDNDAGTDVTLSSLGKLVDGDALFVGSRIPFRGFDIDVDAANGTTSILTIDYWDGSAWVDLVNNNGTTNGSACLGQDGVETWTVPSAWASDSLFKILKTLDVATDNFQSTVVSPDQFGFPPLYWTRWTVSVALDSSTTLNSIHALNRSTAYAELTAGDDVIELAAAYRKFGSVELSVTTGSANTVVTVAGDFKS